MSSDPKWKIALERAIGEDKKANVFQLGTVDAETGAPRVRSVVFREMLWSNDVPVILGTTDVRAGKVRDLRERREVEVCWWVPGREEQFRMVGRGWVVGPGYGGGEGSQLPEVGVGDWEGKRREMFNSMSGRMRASWCVPGVPGERIVGGCEGWRETLGRIGDEGIGEEERKDMDVAFGNFGIVVVEVVEVDHLQLGGERNRRRVSRFEEGKGWMEEEVVP